MISSNNGDHSDPELGDDPLERPNGGGGESRLKFKITDTQFPLVLVLATSFVLLLAVVTWQGTMKSLGYAISVPVISLILSTIFLILTVFKENLYTLYGQKMTNLLFMWNFTGACFLTFSSPFTTTGNGYFAAWGCVVTSAMALGFTGDAFRSRIEGLGSLLGLAGSSAIVVIALIDFVGGSKIMDGFFIQSIYAMIVAIFTIVFVAAIVYYQKIHAEKKWFIRAKFGTLCFFALLWLILACLVTFSGPFNTTGNGYFASWLGGTCASFATFSAWKELGISTDDVVGFLTPAKNSNDRPSNLSSSIS
jgi:hypothetical protein